MVLDARVFRLHGSHSPETTEAYVFAEGSESQLKVIDGGDSIAIVNKLNGPLGGIELLSRDITTVAGPLFIHYGSVHTCHSFNTASY
ncbi:hypothetical protein V6N11_022512 [Hibiscus sabdariffa]|uniref:Uncharacterized protein n=1 Tax=Hibiscus sabdariffa TaxID=183260 RepID=A0ABR2TJE1_9ROSI